nr:PrsW family intramembrane metalloprotease [Streptomyces sp. HNM0574]
MESSGYALTAPATVPGLSPGALVRTEILRGLPAPSGHGLWTLARRTPPAEPRTPAPY